MMSSSENDRPMPTPVPDYAAMPSWEVYSKVLNIGYVQSFEEGLSLSSYQDVMSAIQKMPDSPEKEEMADCIYRILLATERKDYGYTEPSDPEGIRACRVPYDFPKSTPSQELLAEKIRGAWVGRIAGCLLGKSVEGIRTDELIPLLKETGNYPMHRYIRRAELTEEILGKYRYPLRYRCYADTVSCAPADDDTNYTVLAQKILDDYGRGFTPSDVGNSWLRYQPKNAYCTAERVAYRNLISGYRPPETAIYKNPYREWIGAQIRADYYGYINPGDPETAAGMAWRDASISHIKNGIYGAMLAAAMIACAAVTDSIPEIIRGGLAQIPSGSRLAQRIHEILGMAENGKSAEECFAMIHSLYDEHTEHGWCHTIPNAMIVAASLLYGDGDYAKSIGMAVQTGFDTDCNGATVGSVLGMRNGIRGIPPEWIEPLHGQLQTEIFGVGTVRIDALVEKTLAHIGR